MTTILADARLGVMVCDSAASNGQIVRRAQKVFKVDGALVGLAGQVEQFGVFLAWARTGFQGTPPKMPELEALVLSPSGLLRFEPALPIRVAGGRDAIGTGATAAMAVHEALGFRDPRRAVAITCRHDANSRAPVRVHRLKR